MKSAFEYKVKLDMFEGPLDLLLYLVNVAEVEILNISVAAIAKQYVEYLDIMRELNIDIASDYLSMAATLIRIKSRELLPDTEAESSDHEEEGIVTRQQLIEKLLEYKKFKEAAGSLRIYEAEHFGGFSRGMAEEIKLHEPQQEDIGSVTMFDLITAFKRIVERASQQEGHVRVIQPESVRIDDRIERVLSLVDENSEITFEQLFLDDCRKIVLVVTFMAILELIKMGQVQFRQEDQFGTLYIKKKAASGNKEQLQYEQ